jgi:MFS family permease
VRGRSLVAVPPAVLTRTLLACCAITAAIHLASIALNTLLPFHMTAIGGSKTQIGLLFSVMTAVSMVLRPAVGGWIDRAGANPVMFSGIAALALASIAFPVAAQPSIAIALTAGLGIANGLISTSASVLAARSTGPEHRGEALSLYYLASSLAVGAGPPAAFGLLALGGMSLAFGSVALIAIGMAALVFLLPTSATAPAPGAAPGFRLLSARAIPVSAALVLATIGHSSIYAFLPLSAISRGQQQALAWFFGVYPVCLIACRALLRGLSDRVGRARVALPAMALVACGFFALAVPPSAPSLVVAAFLLSCGASVLYPTLAALVVDHAPESERGLALGTLSGAWDLGVVLGSILVGAVADRVSYGAGFVVGGLGAVLGLIVFYVAERRRLGPTVLPQPAPGV